jgi:ornithine carbamoyltransferase
VEEKNMRHFLSLADLSAEEAREILQLAIDGKRQYQQGEQSRPMVGRTLALLFQKPSLRTRVSFEAGVNQLGGNTVFLSDDVGWGKRESMKDFSAVLSAYVDIIACRARAHQDVIELAEHASCPVINALTDLCHPCQALADLMTIDEIQGGLEGQKLAFVGDANNVARSLVTACGLLGVSMTLACPRQYFFDDPFLERSRKQFPDLDFQQTSDPRDAVQGATAIYTDVWASMGQEKEQATRARDFADYQVHAALLAEADPDAIFLHCLPARRGQEVTDEVMDGSRSRVVEQAENRLHLQKGLLIWLLDPQADAPGDAPTSGGPAAS